MKAGLGLAAVLLLTAALAGCSMCQAPFDCCGPVLGRCGLLSCDWNARRGSAVHPMQDDPQWTTAAPTAANDVTLQQNNDPSQQAPSEYP